MQKSKYLLKSRVPLLFAAIIISLLIASVATPVTFAKISSFTSDKSTYAPGDSVTLSGTDSVANANEGIQVTDPQGTPLLITTVTASNGTFSKTFKLPPGASTGTYTATASGPDDSKTITFTVSTGAAATTPPTTPAAPTAVTIQIGTGTPNRGFGAGSSAYALPELATPGQMVAFVWSVNGEGKVVHTAIHYGTNPGDASKQFYGFPDATQDFYTINPPIDLKGGKVFSGTVLMPKTAGTLYYRAHAIVDGKDYWTNEGKIQVVNPTLPPFDPTPLQNDIKDLKTAVSGLQKDLGDIKTDLQGIHSAMASQQAQPGPAGPAGPAGAAGAQGPSGPEGAAGTPANQGVLVAALIVAIIAIVIAGVSMARKKK